VTRYQLVVPEIMKFGTVCMWSSKYLDVLSFTNKSVCIFTHREGVKRATVAEGGQDRKGLGLMGACRVLSWCPNKGSVNRPIL
jgi:hypothetical protein